MEPASIHNRLKRDRKGLPPKITFLYGFRPIYYFSRAFGMLPFSIVSNSSGELEGPRVSKFDGAWCMISMCIYASLVYSIIYGMEIPQNSSISATILLFGDNFLLIANFIFGILMIGVDMSNRYKFVNLMKKLVLFDNQVTHINLNQLR